jgi:hypothetical protein
MDFIAVVREAQEKRANAYQSVSFDYLRATVFRKSSTAI